MDDKTAEQIRTSDLSEERTDPVRKDAPAQAPDGGRERIMQEVLRLMKKELLRTVSPSRIAVKARVSRDVYRELFDEKPENVLCAVITDHKQEEGLDWKGLLDEAVGWLRGHPEEMKSYYRSGLAGNVEMLIYSFILCFIQDMETQDDIDREWFAHLMSGTVNGIIECYESAQTPSDKDRLDELTANLVKRVRDFASYKGLIGAEEKNVKKLGSCPDGKNENN